MQTVGLDYQETPMVNIPSIADMKTTLTNGVLDEDIYSLHLPGFSKQGFEDQVCKLLHKIIYKLKQSARSVGSSKFILT